MKQTLHISPTARAARRILAAIALTITIVTSYATEPTPKHWDAVAPNAAPKQVKAAFERDNDAPEVAVADNGALYLLMPRKDNVKIFTILGQPIAADTLEAGIWRTRINRRGIYILKIGTTTRRITI